MNSNAKLLLFLLIFIFTHLNGELIWPTNAGRKLSSNFGEFRDDHFHMGIDIKTNGREGFDVFAVEDGFISRMVTNYTGYGKALYLETNSGKTAVYCHLSKFSNELEKKLFSLQSKAGAYHVNSYFDSTDFPFKKGDIIGFTGNSGASFGPHLHFELRSPKGTTLNPLRQGISISDTLPPVLKGMTVFPLKPETLINGFPLPMEFSMIQHQTGLYSILDTIYCTTGKIGFAISLEDKIQQNTNRYQFFKAELFIDDVLAFDFTYDSISFDQTGQMNSIENREFGKTEGLSYHKLFLKNNSAFLPNIELNGQISLSPGIHSLHLSVMDAAGNISRANAEIVWGLTKNKYQQKPRLWLNPEVLHNNIIFNTPLQILNSEAGVFIKFQSSYNHITGREGTLLKNENYFNFKFYQSTLQTFYSSLIPFDEFKNVNSISISTEEGPINFPINSKVAYPNSHSILNSIDQTVTIQFTDSTLYDTALVWIDNVGNPSSNHPINPVTNIYLIEPINLPLKNPAILTFTLNQNQQYMDGLGIYKFNFKKEEWEFQESRFKNSTLIAARLLELGLVTLLQDSTPPEIVNAFPAHLQSYLPDEISSFEYILKDDLSGIEPTEEALKIILDGKPVYCAYQPIMRKLSYSLHDSLSSGEHSVVLIVKDYAGNKLEKTIFFSVN